MDTAGTVAAVLTVPVVTLGLLAPGVENTPLIQAAERSIWLVFAAHFVWSLARAEANGLRRIVFWLDAFIVIVSFPVLPGLLDAVRLLRLLGATRVVAVWRRAQAVRRLLRHKGVGLALGLAFLLVLVLGAALARLEDGYSLMDGVYGFIVPRHYGRLR